MKAFVFVFVLLLVGIAGLGFYRGWFRIAADNAEHQPSATVTVDKDKIRADEEKAKEKVQGFGQKLKQETNEVTNKVKQ